MLRQFVQIAVDDFVWLAPFTAMDRQQRQFLIERGAELDHEEYRDSYTALRLAEFEGHWDIAKILAEAGASDHIDDGRDWYVINYARHAVREDVVDALKPWHDANGTHWEQRQEIEAPPPK